RKRCAGAARRSSLRCHSTVWGTLRRSPKWSSGSAPTGRATSPALRTMSMAAGWRSDAGRDRLKNRRHSFLGERTPECGPNEALCVHCVVDRWHHAEEGMDHPGELLVLDRYAAALQRLCIALTVVVQHVAFASDDNRGPRSGKTGRLDRRGAPILRILRAA